MQIFVRLKSRRVQRALLQYVIAATLIAVILANYMLASWGVISIAVIAGISIVIAYASRRQLHKKHRIKKMFRAVQARMPFFFRMRSICKIWRRKDAENWPNQRLSDAPGLARYEYSLQSQHGEDGILRHLFREIGFSNRCFLEFGFGAAQSNCIRLIMHENFRGTFIDGSEEQCQLMDSVTKHLGIEGIRADCAFLDLENLEEVISRGQLPHDLDLLSIDVDGNDYWFWDRIDFLDPRLVVMEYNAMLGAQVAQSVPYEKEFSIDFDTGYGASTFWGASLCALEKLGEKKNYRLVGCDSMGVNAFFLSNSIVANNVPTLTAAEAWRPYANWIERGINPDEQFALTRKMPFVDV